MTKPIVRIRVDFDSTHSIGPGKIELLEHIRESGSLSQAGRDIGMSYRRAWLLLDSLNTSFRKPVVATSVGGRAGGGAKLTPFGEDLIGAYRKLEAEVNLISAKMLATICKSVSPVGKAVAVTRTPLVRSPAPRRVTGQRAARKAGGRVKEQL